ncbi:MAG: hypothetical protein WDN23_10835 [Edaphobacter sp.]
MQQGEALEEEDREDAGHQVENDAAEEGETDGGEGGDAAGGGSGVVGVGCGRDLAGNYRSGDVVGDLVGELEDTVEGCGESFEVFGATDAEANTVGERFDLLGSGVGDLFLVEGVELGVGLALACGKGEDEVGGSAGDGESGVRWQGFGDEGEGFAERTYGLGGGGGRWGRRSG